MMAIGIFLFILVLGLSLWSYKLLPESWSLAMLLLVISAIILRLYVSSDPYLHEWDERYHALAAKNMMQHPLKPTLYDNPVLHADYKSWQLGHIWVHKQPVTLWAIMCSFLVFGVEDWAVRIPSILFSVLSVLAVFGLAKELYNIKVGWWAAFLLMIHGLWIELASGRVATDHVDVLFSSLVLLGCYCAAIYQNRRLIGIVGMGVFIGLAILTKWLPALIVLPFLAALHFHFIRSRIGKSIIDVAIVLMVAAAIAVPWQVYIITNYPLESAWEYSFNRRHLFEVLEGHSGSWYYYLDKYRLLFGEACILI
jgi:4-amino-4-deoxy-L-arabinose transferase